MIGVGTPDINNASGAVTYQAANQPPEVSGVLPVVVVQHSEETATLWQLRRSTLALPHSHLRNLLTHDDRLDAHIDGLRIAGEAGWRICQTRILADEPGTLFAAAVLALEAGHRQKLDAILAFAEAVPDAHSPLMSALGWVSPEFLQGRASELLTSEAPFARRMGLACCALHRVDPRQPLSAGLQDSDALLRARAIRAAGELGRQDLGHLCVTTALTDDDDTCRSWAAWSAALLGNRGVALDALSHVGQTPGAHTSRAFRLSLQAMKIDAAHQVLQDLATDPERLRWLIQGAGIAGDPTYVQWLIGHMEKDETARIAGEAFSLITGLDLTLLDLERKPPEDFESGPNDDPDDPNVAIDEDDGLAWPDPQKVQRRWDANKSRFTPGQRYFMGAPVTREHCIQVLKTGYQRQRILAAHYLCLLEPGTPLFNTGAPAWRQQRQLADMK